MSTGQKKKSSERFSRGLKRQRREATSHRIASVASESVQPVLKVLASYHYFKDVDLRDHIDRVMHPIPCEVMADSGGFTAWTLGKPIRLQDYIDWCHAWASYLHCYVVLDDVTSAEQTWQNQREMENQGLHPIPVFHWGEDWSYLDRYLSRYPYIMLGGMVTRSDRVVMPWAIQCFKRAKSTGAVFHGLGASSKQMLESLPFYSADATSFISGARFGNMAIYDRGSNSWTSMHVSGRDIAHHQLSVMRRYGLSESLLRRELPAQQTRHMTTRAKGVSPRDATVISVSAASWVQYEAYLRERHGRIYRPDRPDELPGMRYYLVLALPRIACFAKSKAGIRPMLLDALHSASAQ